MATRLLLPLLLFVPLSSSRLLGDDLSSLPQLKDYTTRRATSSDPSGGNDDGTSQHPIQPGEQRTIAELTGPGVLKHLWFTIADPERYHLKKIVLRMYWDADPLPAVEAPIGDFFGLGLGEYVMYESGPLSVGSQKSLNCYFPMPFRKSARITVTNEGAHKVDAFYYNLDWEQHKSLPENVAYFYAEYRQATPNKGRTDDWTDNGSKNVNDAINKDGAGNYVMFETEGRGHYVGVTLSILQNQGDWWGEGDEMMFIDDRDRPTIIGTGSEDYFLGAWCYGSCGLSSFGNFYPTFAYERYGNPRNGGANRGSEWMVYRFHTDSPVSFEKYFKMTIEHGHANHRSDNFYSVGYWYQQGSHHLRQPLPRVADRIPRQFNMGGPTMGNP